jgi:seryl-tRNA synthetase
MSAAKSPREVATDEVRQHQEIVARWSAEQAAATAELESLQERAGEEVLADESAAGRLSRSMQELRDRIDIASRAVAAATPKMEAAARAAVLAEADEWSAEQARRQELLDAHDAKTRKLLDALEQHTGRHYEPGEAPRMGSSVAGEAFPRVVTVAPGHTLWLAVREAERTAWCLREVAEGRDPHAELSIPFEGPMFQGVIAGPDAARFYPPSVWGAEAILPAPAYSRAQS